MALTLVEAAKFSNDVLQKGVIETIVSDTPILKKLGFIDIKGNGLTYNREGYMGGAAFHLVNGVWTESTPELRAQVTVTTKILGGDADVDNYLKTTRSDIQDLEAETITEKAKAVRDTFMDRFYYGNATTSPEEFDGLHILIPGAVAASGTIPAMVTRRVVNYVGTSGYGLGMNKVKEAIRICKDGKPDAILMSKLMLDLITRYRESIANMQYDLDEFQKKVMFIDGIPVWVDDYIADVETHTSAGAFSAKTGGTNTSIFLAKFGPKYIQGVQSLPITVKKVATDLETKDATRTRIKWYPGLMLQKVIGVSVITGIDTAYTVAATPGNTAA